VLDVGGAAHSYRAAGGGVAAAEAALAGEALPAAGVELATLQRLTERYCVVLQTLRTSASVTAVIEASPRTG
jgi:O-acetyl-ADP-ribose deacetylase (regulator of RNase III)